VTGALISISAILGRDSGFGKFLHRSQELSHPRGSGCVAPSGLGNTTRGPTNLKHRSGSAAQVQAEAAVELRILRQIALCFPVIPYQA